MFELIEKAVQRPVQPVEEADIEQQEQSRVVCSESLVYQSDQILRKLVSQQMTSAKGRKEITVYILYKFTSFQSSVLLPLAQSVISVPTCSCIHFREKLDKTRNEVFCRNTTNC